MLDSLSEPIKTMFDVGSFSIAVAALLKAIPALTAVVGFIWLLMRVYESYLNIKKLKKES